MIYFSWTDCTEFGIYCLKQSNTEAGFGFHSVVKKYFADFYYLY